VNILQMDTSLDPKLVASNVYTSINENARVRVFKATFKPGDTAKMHHHPFHVVYVLKGGKLKLTSEGKNQELDLKEGSAVFLEAQNHEATNIGDSVIELLVMEIKSN
jgi:quercetin dioxygenase-like cupin family protein